MMIKRVAFNASKQQRDFCIGSMCLLRKLYSDFKASMQSTVTQRSENKENENGIIGLTINELLVIVTE